MQWFYASNGQQHGPIAEAELDRLAQIGTLKPETLVWREGMSSWQPYGSVRPSTSESGANLPPVLDQAICAECQRPFGKNDLVRYENLFVCAECKPVFFQKLREGLMPGGVEAIWRSENLLVMRKDAALPARCVKCNADAPGEQLTRKLFWHHPLLYLLILPGLLIYAIVATIVGKRAKIKIGLCQAHRARRTRNLLIAWGLFALSVLCFVLAGITSYGWLVGTGVVLLLASPVYGMIACAMVTPKRIDDHFVWLKGVSPEFLETLREFPGRT